MLKSPQKTAKNRAKQLLQVPAPIPFLRQKNLIALMVLLPSLGWLTWQQRQFFLSPSQPKSLQSSSLVSLRSLAPDVRSSQLKLMIDSSGKQQTPDRLRARYLLAVDLINKGQGKQALVQLQSLDQDYTLLRPQILFKTAQAYQQSNQKAAAERTFKYLIKTYSQHPLAANAIFLLEKNQENYESRLVTQYPFHPLTHKIARSILRRHPERFDLLLLLAKYSRDNNLNSIRDRLVLEYPAQLTTEDWGAIADGYWREGEHRKAADAYALAEPIPRHLYRAARGFHRNGNLSIARRAYQRLLREYYDSREAGQALLDLASISSGDEAVVYLEKAIAQFPQYAPQAYRAKARVHQRFSKHQAAQDSRQKLLSQYPDSAAAAKYRWNMAQKLAAQGNKADAWVWMQPLIKSQQEFDFAPRGIYTAGKWALELNKPDGAHQAFSQLIRLYPQSYWAWRAAVRLGWNVGNFEDLRSFSPQLNLTKTYSPLPMGSDALQELYLLGQYKDAWLLLQTEIQQPQQLSVSEQFTASVLMVELGQYSAAMESIWGLTQRESAEELKQWRALRQTQTYWQSLFPIPYQTAVMQHAQQQQLNPLLVVSVMRKESSFDPKINSAVGAVGLMQIVPPTARWVAQQLQLPDYSLTNPEDNIRIGTWYLRHNHRRYDDNSLLAVASYNAGTSNVNVWINRYGSKDFDRFVEQIPFRETQDYVEGVFGNYWNYLRLYNPEIRQQVEQLRSP
ncbi:MAG: transglycosylase SLT domain-containing protein [Cyanobacteria bacterium J06621_8]